MQHMHDDDGELPEISFIRPYMLTKGRTRSTGVPVAMESLVDRRRIDESTYRRLDKAQRDIFDVLTERLSAAEISAALKLPLGVIIVLIGDMGRDEIVTVHKAADLCDEQLIRRLIAGVRAL